MTTPITGTFDEVRSNNAKLASQRLLEFAVFVAPETAPAITTIVDATGAELSIPSEYTDLGFMSKDQGATLTPGVETSESTAYGTATPLAFYTISRSLTTSFTMKETKKHVLEIHSGVDMSGVQAAVTTREIKWDIPDRPETRFMRLLLLGVHGSGVNQIFHAHFLPRVMVTDIGEQSWSETEDLVYPITFSALFDSTLGTSQRSFIAGPGLTADVVTAMGFETAAV